MTEQINAAFDYRGMVTVSRRDGSKLVGFVYDRGPEHVEMFDEAAVNRIRVAIGDIAEVALSGEDTAAKAQRIWEKRKGALEPSETSIWGEWGEHPVLFVVALPMELRILAKVLGAMVQGTVVRGPGFVAATVGVGGGVAQVVAAERPRLVVSCGFAGALDPTLRTGEIIRATAVTDENGDTITAPSLALGDLHAVAGEIWCATQVAASAAEKRALARPGRLAVDMETWPVARAATRAGIPWLSVRVVLDEQATDLPAFTRSPRSSYVVPALRHALRGPRAVLDLARLGLAARTASRALSGALAKLAPALLGADRTAS